MGAVILIDRPERVETTHSVVYLETGVKLDGELDDQRSRRGIIESKKTRSHTQTLSKKADKVSAELVHVKFKHGLKSKIEFWCVLEEFVPQKKKTQETGFTNYAQLNQTAFVCDHGVGIDSTHTHTHTL